MAIECYKNKCCFHATNTTDEEGPYCFESECKEPKVTCFVCGSEDIATKIVEEFLCFDGKTVLCYCPKCELDWYDDTLLGE